MKKAKIYLTDYCPYCHRAYDLLKRKGFDIEVVDVTNDKATWDAISKVTGIDTVPQIFIDGEFVGGCDDLYSMESRGEI